MQLVPYAKRWYKMISIQANSINASFLVAWASMPETFQNIVPKEGLITIAVVLLILGTFGALVKQKSVSDDTTKQ